MPRRVLRRRDVTQIREMPSRLNLMSGKRYSERGPSSPRHVAHLDQVEMTLWSWGRLVQAISLPIENAEALAAQLHTCVRTAQAEQEANRAPA